MSRYRVTKGSHTDYFVDLFAARRKRDNKWKGKAKIEEEQANGNWVEVN